MPDPMTIEQIAAELTGLSIRSDSPRMSGKATLLILSKLADRLDLLVHLAAINGQRAAEADIRSSVVVPVIANFNRERGG